MRYAKLLAALSSAGAIASVLASLGSRSHAITARHLRLPSVTRRGSDLVRYRPFTAAG